MCYPNVDFLYLSEDDMVKAGVTDMGQCVETMEEVLRLLVKGDYMMSGDNGDSHGAMVTFPDHPAFPNMPKNGPDRRFMAMPAYLGGKFDVAGMKWYGSNVDNRDKGLPRSILMFMLNDKETGAPISLMSANLLSAYRTGALPGVGAKALARKDSRVAAIVGPGVMGKTNIEAFACACPLLDTVKVKGRGKQSLDSFVDFVKSDIPQIEHIEVVDTIEEAVRGADVISVATSSPTDVADYPMIETAWIKPGATFCLPAAANFEDALLVKAKKFVDNMGLYDAWAAEYPYPTYASIPIIGSRFMDMVHEGQIGKKDIIDIGDVLNGEAAGRDNDEQIVIFSVGGMPVEDVAWGKVVYDNARKMGLGVSLNLWQEPKMV